jgi:hypothetical protein
VTVLGALADSKQKGEPQGERPNAAQRDAGAFGPVVSVGFGNPALFGQGRFDQIETLVEKPSSTNIPAFFNSRRCRSMVTRTSAFLARRVDMVISRELRPGGTECLLDFDFSP